MNNLERGFIPIDKIFDFVSESDIFELVFGFKPTENIYVTSPFREDKNPGCYFTNYNNTLWFIDFANFDVINDIKMNAMNCFHVVQVYYKLDNFYKTLEFIKRKLINDKTNRVIKVKTVKQKKQTIINIKPKLFTLKDKQFWLSYGITLANLINDKVFRVKKLQLLNTKKGDITTTLYEPCYSFNNFDNNKKKIYKPFQKGHKRFISNVTSNDIGEIDSLTDYGKKLIISKSYKDARVLRNENLNCIWFQNEGMIPSDQKLVNLCKRFNHIIVFFDNDDVGIKASIKVKNVINKFFPGKANNLYLPLQLKSRGISDPSDLYKKKGPKHLKQFLKNELNVEYK